MEVVKCFLIEDGQCGGDRVRRDIMLCENVEGSFLRFGQQIRVVGKMRFVPCKNLRISSRAGIQEKDLILLQVKYDNNTPTRTTMRVAIDSVSYTIRAGLETSYPRRRE